MYYLLVIISTILLAVQFAFNKKYQTVCGANLHSSLVFNFIGGIFIALFFFLVQGAKLEFSFFSLLMSAASSALVVLYTILGFKIMEAGNMALYSVCLMSGGMLLPYFFGVFFLDEKLSFARIAGVLMILCGVVLSNSPKEKLSLKVTLLCAAVFVSNGFVSIVSKCHQIPTAFHSVDTISYLVLSGIARTVLTGIMLLFVKPKNTNSSSKVSFPIIAIIAAASVIGGISSLFQLFGASHIPATVLYPIITGGAIVFMSLSGKVFFKEKISKNQWISIALCFVGTFLFL